MHNKQTILARPALARFASELKRFEPQTLLAWSGLENLLVAGTTVDKVTRDEVHLRRGPQTAIMDKHGRVQWTTDFGYFTRLKARITAPQGAVKAPATAAAKNPASRLRRKLKASGSKAIA